MFIEFPTLDSDEDEWETGFGMGRTGSRGKTGTGGRMGCGWSN
jgi:hypothetical protein